MLAERYPAGDILVLTLNRPLAALINDLISTCASPIVRDRIKVLAFFDLCQEFLFHFEPKNRKLYDDRTWKSGEHIDEVWREYYRCELNNRDAVCMQPVHDSLISRSIDSERYIREEFDWIRSAMSYSSRQRYFDMARSGRSYPLDKRFRRFLIDGLQRWENKMRDVGITDYLGIATALYRHRDKLREKYRCALIDECQDFGTIELEIITAIVENGPDNLFFCGDAAQHVSWKHQSLKDAGVPVPGARSKTIRQNYRNSRDVLQAAYKILVENRTEEMSEKEDFDILDPEYANFSGSTPLCLEASSLAEEIAYAVAYAKSELMENINRKACIAICGCSSYEIQEFGKRIEISVLEGTRSIDDGSLFLSDLQQTKGFEFDLVCVVNASDGMIPNPATPEREQFRDLSKLYVAMTRAKLQLVLSYSGVPSAYIVKAEETLLHGKWTDFVSKEEVSDLGVPPDLDDLRKPVDNKPVDDVSPFGSMTGEQFLYTPGALGLSPRLIGKLRDLITGQGRTLDGTPRYVAHSLSGSERYPRLPGVSPAVRAGGSQGVRCAPGETRSPPENFTLGCSRAVMRFGMPDVIRHPEAGAGKLDSAFVGMPAETDRLYGIVNCAKLWCGGPASRSTAGRMRHGPQGCGPECRA